MSPRVKIAIVGKYNPEVKVFFYGSFINRQVLAKGGLVPERVEVARLLGFDIHIETLATLVRSDRHCVYGIVCEASQAELRRLYGQEWLDGAYRPEAVLVETDRGALIPALCYIATTPPPARPANDYLDWITRPAREYGFPDWYLQRLESFRKKQ
ncbi:MAG: gamma-glutamylcyclotransferase [Verrucomicrobiales bacterium]|nr:gamma-glutamylcyclotransferase [Verrucomicrobiales bacterium]